MHSLRSRLVLAFGLVAVLPLAAAMWLMAGRIRQSVDADADARLQAALASVERVLEAESDALASRLEVMTSEPAFARLYPTSPADTADLTAFLDARRALLGLDALEVEAREPGAPLSFERGPRKETLARVVRAPIVRAGETIGSLTAQDTLDRTALLRFKEVAGVELVLRDHEGTTIASTLAPDQLPFLALLEDPKGAELPRKFRVLSRALPFGAQSGFTMLGLASTASSDTTVALMRWTAVLLGLAGLVFAVILGAIWSRRIAGPVERLAEFSERIARGDWDEPLEVEGLRELETLATSLDRMRADLTHYRERIKATERHAAWREMAKEVAHEIKNPLTPIAVSVADLRRSHAQGRPDFPQILEQVVRTVNEEVEALRRMLSAFSELGGVPEPRMMALASSDLIADVKGLYRVEIAEDRLSVTESIASVRLWADRDQLRQALVNLVKNGLEAAGPTGRVRLSVSDSGQPSRRILTIEVADDGPGMSEHALAQLFTPHVTSKAGGSGLGLTIAQRIALDHGGNITVQSTAGRGSTFALHIPVSEEA